MATALVALSQATVHNVNLLSEKLSQAESDNHKLKEEVMMRPRRFEQPFWISMQSFMM